MVSMPGHLGRSRHRCCGHRECGRSNFDGCRAAAAEQCFHECDCTTDVGAATQPFLPRVCVLLQALSERTTCAEDQCLDGSLCQPKLSRDLAVCEPLPLPQKNRAPLVLRHRFEDVLQADQLVTDLLASGDDFLEDLEVVRCLDLAAAPGGAPAGEAHVVRDLEQPGGFELGDDPARESAEGVHERRLDGVLRLLTRAELMEAVAVDL